MAENSLADDEAALAGHAQALLEAVAAVIDAWIRRSVAARAPHLAESAEVAAAAQAASVEVLAELAELLGTDIDDQTEGPLQVLRRGTRFATDVLRGAGVSPIARDEFAVRAFPDDVYDLSPATFGDVDPSLHEPGLIWGAAKAHVHLRRRREPEAAQTATRVVVLSADLMDRSKISASLPEAELVRSWPKLVEALAEPAALALIDLARVDDPSALALLADRSDRLIAYGSHVDEARLAAAAGAGADALPRSVFFRRLAEGLI